MTEITPSPLNNVITIDDERIKSHLDRVVRGSVEETLNALLDAEADRLCNAQRYERSEARRDTRAGHYERKLQPARSSCGYRSFGRRRSRRRLSSATGGARARSRRP
jgi:transposase-like protein